MVASSGDATAAAIHRTNDEYHESSQRMYIKIRVYLCYSWFLPLLPPQTIQPTRYGMMTRTMIRPYRSDSTLASCTRACHPLAAVPPAESWRWQVVVFLGYLLVGIVFTWPLVLHVDTHVIQKGAIPVDAGQNIWNLWWVRQALLTGSNPYLTRYLFYPEQINLFWQTLGLPNALLVLPILLFAGPVVAFNTLILLSFGLGGYFAYRLGRTVLTDRIAALIVGFVFAFTPHHMQPLLGGALEIVAIQWIPLYVLLLMRALQQQTVLSVLGAALLLTVTTLASHYYGLFCAVYTLLHVLLAALLATSWQHDQQTEDRRPEIEDRGHLSAKRSERNALERSNARTLECSNARTLECSNAASYRLLMIGVAIAGIWVITLLPFVWDREMLQAAAPEDWYTRQLFHSTALVDFLGFNVLHPLWGKHVVAWLDGLHPFGVESGAAPGLVVYLLIAWGLRRDWQANWPWLALAIGMLILSMGPELKIGSEPTGVPLPFRLLNAFDPFRNSSRPSRFIALMMLPVSVLAGYGMQALRERWCHRRSVVASLVMGLLLCELMVAPWPMMPIQVDPLYAALNVYQEPGAVIELPPRTNDSQYMLNQLCHGRPLVGGYLARTPIYPLVAHDTTVRRLWYAETVQPDVFQVDAANELDRLGIRFIVLNRAYLSRAETARLQQQLAVPGIIRYAGNAQIEIYRVNAAAPRPVLLPTTGWYAAETDGEQTWRWIGDTARMQVLARSQSVVALTLTLTGYQSPRPLRVAINDEPLADINVPAAPQETTLRLSFVVPAGVSDLRLESEALPAHDGRQLSVSVTRLTFSSSERPDQAVPPPLDPPPVLSALPWVPCRNEPDVHAFQ